MLTTTIRRLEGCGMLAQLLYATKRCPSSKKRGGEYPSSVNQCLKWLDKRPTGSVVYTCFGSGSLLSVEQLREVALGIEASSHPFVWFVRNKGDDLIP
ncbi:hypothetical protein KFK09_008336 [Dendrobium nobile]|uniref:Uncharacterized protein n=1 Tax=Dendrobium nobile TaxID=94219 RepID=A0A8T3BPN7_DENNO|nr:hypothetical protein KFK09_008336 [Dendrobium nobile]